MPDAEYTIVPAAVSDAAEIHAVKMRAFAEEGRLSGSMDIPPLEEDLAAVERDIRMHSVLIARVTGRTVGSARGKVSGTSCEIRAVCASCPRSDDDAGLACERICPKHAPAFTTWAPCCLAGATWELATGCTCRLVPLEDDSDGTR